MTDNEPSVGEITPLDSSRALVFVERRLKARILPRAASDFVAQLIASNRRFGEFRRALRRDPAVGVGEYRSSCQTDTPGFERRV